MDKTATSSLKECAREVTLPRRNPLMTAALLLTLALGTSACAVRINKHGNYGGPYDHTEVVLGGGPAVGRVLDKIQQSGIPVLNGAAAQLNQQRAYVDAEGRTVLMVPKPVPTMFCGDPDHLGRASTDCTAPSQPPNAGFFQQVAPDSARVICPEGARLVTAVDRSSPNKTTYLVCQTGQGGMVSAGLEVNGIKYWLQPPPGVAATPNSFGAFDVEKVRQKQFSTAGVWLNNTP